MLFLERLRRTCAEQPAKVALELAIDWWALGQVIT